MQGYGFIVRPFEIEHLSPRITAPAEAPLHLAEIGLFQSRGGFRWEQVASRLALHCIRSGSGVFVENGVPVQAGEGDLVLFRPGRHYRYFDHTGSAWRYDFLMLEGPLPKGLLADKAFLGQKPSLWPILEAAIDAYRGQAVPFASAARLGWTVIEALGVGVPTPSIELPDAVRNFVGRREAPFPTVEQIAAHLGMDRSTLYRKFRAATGLSVKSWLDGERMGRAERLLLHSTATVGDVASICGFRDPLYFSRAFSKRHGLPPGQWRRRTRAALR